MITFIVFVIQGLVDNVWVRQNQNLWLAIEIIFEL
jgi:hypothetical protein